MTGLNSQAMTNNNHNLEFKWPRRQILRTVLRGVAYSVMNVVSEFRVIGRENLPKHGPLIVVGNHFSYLDPVAMIGISPWPIEFIGGFVNPAAPPTVRMLPKTWGYYPVFRGTASRYALVAAEEVLKQGGVLGIYPEAGSWAAVLRPARPGTAFIAARTGAPILPVGFDGLVDVFPRLNKLRRAKVTVRIGKPFGPFKVTGKGRDRRRQMDEIGDEIMQHIAELIPPERRGYYSDDPDIREAAKGTEIYPWAHAVEGDFKPGDHL